MLNQVRPALALVAVMTLITGVAYPLVVTGVAQVAFPGQANGSLLVDEGGQVRGSRLIAQPFEGDEWFHSRPSAGSYATVASGASNLAPGNPALAARVSEEAGKLYVAGQGPVPLALLTTSGSGLDPELPPEAVKYQVARVAAARGMAVEALHRLVDEYTLRPLVGPAVVNVLMLNAALGGIE